MTQRRRRRGGDPEEETRRKEEEEGGGTTLKSYNPNTEGGEKPTLAQTIDQVMTIKTHTESSKTELSSRGKRPFKVFRFSRFFCH